MNNKNTNRSEKKQKIEFKPEEACPYESGKSYKDCCMESLFKWTKDSLGNIYKSIPLSEPIIKTV